MSNQQEATECEWPGCYASDPGFKIEKDGESAVVCGLHALESRVRSGADVDAV